MRRAKLSQSIIPALVIAVAVACSSRNGSDGNSFSAGSDDAEEASTGTSSGGSSSGSSSSVSSGGFAPPDAAPTNGDDGGHAESCSDGGCACLRIASIGHEGIWGACGRSGADGTSALVSWLNSQSSAKVDTYDTAKPTLTTAFLGQYDVLVLQWLRDVTADGTDGPLWQFSSDEVSALAAWVNAGGGIITLSGYDSMSADEVTPLNTLISFTAFQYNMDSTNGTDTSGGACWGGASGLTGWNNATPVGTHLTEIGISYGRSISVSPDAGSVTVDCPCNVGNPDACAAHQDVGKGHVFAYSDEWVTYTSMWTGVSSCIPATCTNTPATAFQVPQFWYNAIRYASSSVTCFTINNPKIIE